MSSSISLSDVLKQQISLISELIYSAKLASQLAPGTLPDSAPLLLESQVGCHDYEAFTRVLEIQTLLLGLVQQKPYPLSISIDFYFIF